MADSELIDTLGYTDGLTLVMNLITSRASRKSEKISAVPKVVQFSSEFLMRSHCRSRNSAIRTTVAFQRRNSMVKFALRADEVGQAGSAQRL
jgi:hypothetical protein